MKNTAFYIVLLISLTNPSYGAETSVTNEFLKSIFADNNKHVSEISREHFKSFAEQQTPRATVLSCSDSRVQSDAFHKSPVNDLFIIRNIGNQINTTEGSIEYGINHLHTPVLLIIGHSDCGAIKTARGNYSGESKAIRVELDHLRLSPKVTTNEGVIENVHHQVNFAKEKFKKKVDNKELVVVGAVYDFRDDFGKGHGRLILINIDGEKDPDKIRKNPLLKGVNDVAIGIKSPPKKPLTH